MYYVYIIQSESSPTHYYTGLTSDLDHRIDEHNSGNSIYTNKFKPWKLVLYVAFTNQDKAEKFEKYLKTGSGREFCKRHFLEVGSQVTPEVILPPSFILT